MVDSDAAPRCAGVDLMLLLLLVTSEARDTALQGRVHAEAIREEKDETNVT